MGTGAGAITVVVDRAVDVEKAVVAVITLDTAVVVIGTVTVAVNVMVPLGC